MPDIPSCAKTETELFVVIAVWEWGSFHSGWTERWARLGTAKRA